MAFIKSTRIEADEKEFVGAEPVFDPLNDLVPVDDVLRGFFKEEREAGEAPPDSVLARRGLIRPTRHRPSPQYIDETPEYDQKAGVFQESDLDRLLLRRHIWE